MEAKIIKMEQRIERLEKLTEMLMDNAAALVVQMYAPEEELTEQEFTHHTAMVIQMFEAQVA